MSIRRIDTFKDNPDDIELSSIHTIVFECSDYAISKDVSQFVLVVEDGLSNLELAQNLREFADMVQFGITGEFH